jgi:hypothetical protein
MALRTCAALGDGFVTVPSSDSRESITFVSSAEQLGQRMAASHYLYGEQRRLATRPTDRRDEFRRAAAPQAGAAAGREG